MGDGIAMQKGEGGKVNEQEVWGGQWERKWKT